MSAVLDTAIRTSARDLERALATRFPVVLVFEDPGAEPCRITSSRLESAAENFIDLVRVVRVSELDPKTLVRYGVSAVPTLIFRRHGMEVARIVGAPSPEALHAHFDYVAGHTARPVPAVGPSVKVEVPGAEPAASAPAAVNDATFEEAVMCAPVPVLVEFGSTWCRPCREMAPLVADLARTYAGRIRVATVDTDGAPGVAGRYGIASLPTFVLFRSGHPVFRATGAVPRPILEQALRGALSLP
jgi:thioredoxin 1